MELPIRWGVSGGYQDGKSAITCRTFNIHEHSLNSLESIQTRWHPNSPTDSHLLVLLSDNSIRMYEESDLRHVWRVGPIPNNAAVEKNLSYLQSLGETAVDFEIAPPNIRENSNTSLNETESQMATVHNSFSSLSINSKKNPLLGHQKKIEWPIVVLRGNGTIYVLTAGLNTDNPRLQGPLTVFPAQNTNYGDDSCSLLVIPTLPLTVVIAENSGILHHALLVESASFEELSMNETKTVLKNDWDLYILESIELELGLPEDNEKDSLVTPVILKRDPVNDQRYFCYHRTGLHGITIEFVKQLQSYVNEDAQVEPNMNVKSRAEYILSTKAFNSSLDNAVVGMGLLQSPSGILTILSSGQVVSLDTIKLSLSVYSEQSVHPPEVVHDMANDRKVPFDQHVKSILSSGTSQPILKLNKTKPPSSQKAFELLMNGIQVLRENHLKHHDVVRQEITKRMKVLELMKNQQKIEIAQLLEDKELIQEKAYKLADMHEDIMESHQNLQTRVQDILRLASLRWPSGNSSDKEFAEQIKKMKLKTDKLLQDAKQIRAKNDFQKKQFDNWTIGHEDSIKSLPPKQEETIKEILIDITKQVTSLTKEVKKISSIIDV